MPSPSIWASQTITWSSSGAAQSASASEFYNTIVVSNQTGVVLSVCTDGGTATVNGAHTQDIPNGSTVTVSNAQPLPQWNQSPTDSVRVVNGNQLVGNAAPTSGNAQQGYDEGCRPTTISLIPASTVSSGYAVVTFS